MLFCLQANRAYQCPRISFAIRLGRSDTIRCTWPIATRKALYISKKFAKLSSLRSVELSHNNLTHEHFGLLTKLLLDSSVHLFALDLSWNSIFARNRETFLPAVPQLMTRTTHIDLAGNLFAGSAA